MYSVLSVFEKHKHRTGALPYVASRWPVGQRHLRSLMNSAKDERCVNSSRQIRGSINLDKPPRKTGDICQRRVSCTQIRPVFSILRNRLFVWRLRPAPHPTMPPPCSHTERKMPYRAAIRHLSSPDRPPLAPRQGLRRTPTGHLSHTKRADNGRPPLARASARGLQRPPHRLEARVRKCRIFQNILDIPSSPSGFLRPTAEPLGGHRRGHRAALSLPASQ